MHRRELATEIYQVSHLTGTFTLRSGQVSSEYFDKYLFESEPGLLAEIATHLAEMVPAGTEILAGLELGGVPLATVLSLKTGIPAIFVRKKAKEYGTAKLAEGTDFAGKKVCVIEDVITTGGQVVMSSNDLRERGAKVEHVLCVRERDIKGRENLKKDGLELLSLFTMEELKSSKA
jgi:orotate phosphoribosyltransferase